MRSATVDFRQDPNSYIESMRKHLRDLKKLSKENPEQAKKEARESLVRMGVFNSDGTPKKKIVTMSVLI